jgi:peptide/nickel transport system substrate-binding protein
MGNRLAVLVAFVALLGAYEPHVLTYADGGDISSLNPFLASEGNAPAYSELTMAEFARFDARGNPIPELITEIPTRTNGGISKDGRTITYHLRRNVKWSDGQPFNAADVVFTVAVAKDERNNLFLREPWDHVAAATAPDEFTVAFHLKEPYATFIEDYFSTESSSCVLPKHILGPETSINQAPYNSLPVGIGPFRYAAYNRGDSVVMEANPYYWRGRPKLQRVVYKLITDQNTLMTQLQTGEISLWPAINGPLANRAKALPNKRWTSWLTNFMGGIYFNVTRPQVVDPRVRRALRLATDRDALFDKVVHRNGIITESTIPRTSQDYFDIPVTKLDPVAAARMLDADGWKLESDGIRHKNGIELTLDVAIPSGYQPSEMFAALLEADWAKIGVGVTIHTWSTPQFFAPYSSGGIIQSGRFDAALYSSALGPIFANINGYYDYASIPPRGGGNGDRYCNHQLDALNERYLHSYDGRVRHEAAAAMQRLLDRDVPAIVIYERTYLSVYDSRLMGYHPNSFSFWGDPLKIDM